MDKNVLVAVVTSDETITLLCIEPLHFACRQGNLHKTWHVLSCHKVVYKLSSPMQVPRCNTNVHHVFALRSRASFPCMQGATEGESCALLALRRHDPVDPGILLLHLTHEVMVIQRLAGHPDEKILWIVQGAVLVNPGPLPFTKHVKATCRDLPVEIRDLLPGRGKELRSVKIPEHVRREVSKQAPRPVDVLEDAVGIIGNLDAEILFNLGIPEVWKVGHIDFPVAQSFLDL